MWKEEIDIFVRVEWIPWFTKIFIPARPDKTFNNSGLSMQNTK